MRRSVLQTAMILGLRAEGYVVNIRVHGQVALQGTIEKGLDRGTGPRRSRARRWRGPRGERLGFTWTLPTINEKAMVTSFDRTESRGRSR